MVSISKKRIDRQSCHTENIIPMFVESARFENPSQTSDQIEKGLPRRKIHTSIESIQIPRLSKVQRLILRIGCVIRLGILHNDNDQPIVLFLRHCRKHGIIVTYPQGYLGKLRCSKCLEERRKSDANNL